MAETLKRHRETFAWVVLAASAAYIVISLVNLGYLATRPGGLVEAARHVGGSSLSVVMCLAVLAATLSCVLVRPATARARQILRLGASLVSAAATLELVFLVIGLFGGRFGAFGAIVELLGGLLEVTVKGAIAYLLWRALAGAPEPQAVAPSSATEVQPTPEVDQPPLTSASWSADQAAGAVWTRAGDAASGAAASGWGHPGEQAAGWQLPPVEGTAQLPSSGSQGPWATAGQLAAGEEGVPAPLVDDATPPQAGTVRWTPAPRED